MSNAPTEQQDELLSSRPRSSVMRRFLANHQSPLSILVLSMFVGVFAGLLCTFFDIAIDWVVEQRHLWVTQHDGVSFLTILAVVVSSALLSAFGFFLVKAVAPEAAGSGIPEIEGALDGLRPVRWWRVIPVKFFGGIGSIGAGLVLGREGPSVQMGASVGRMMTDIFRLKDDESRHTLVASGAAAGLAAAFNAPLAGIMFVVEEMRPQFKYNLISVKAVIIASIMATITYRSLMGQGAMIPLPANYEVPLVALLLFLVLGLVFGGIGVCFNQLVVMTMDRFEQFHQNKLSRFVGTGAILGASFGLLVMLLPSLSGGGVTLIPEAAEGKLTIAALVVLFLARTVATLVCFGSGAPGGVFAPMLALGTLFGTCFGIGAMHFFPSMEISAGMFAVAGMGALFAATVRAPITGILLVIELTHKYELILPLLITTLGATMTAQALGGKPLYSQLLQRSLAKQKAREEESESQEQPTT
ncbi:H(+)/Cl(-) exchange transporter ClcA [Enterovibrio nigricans]|uniref:Chloride channel protein, CIC family n=1 Tax=Enterovibrio nigricans DSM 22720 TaxID=1121868 RepID=A0A1T4V001_9GAMM|nr:H(+)/Cl(-) exchange transporter ClcA [Enterovibrio nigricans]SKA58226.1 chloride channel protein, CIC family [Enterovibrio nigricans DSM 22720]